MGGDRCTRASLVPLRQVQALTPETRGHQGSSATRRHTHVQVRIRPEWCCGQPATPARGVLPRTQFSGRHKGRAQDQFLAAPTGPSTEEAFNDGCRTESGAKLDSHQRPSINTACGWTADSSLQSRHLGSWVSRDSTERRGLLWGHRQRSGGGCCLSRGHHNKHVECWATETHPGTSLVVQRLKLCVSNAGGPVSIHVMQQKKKRHTHTYTLKYLWMR